MKELTTSHTLYDFSDITQDIRVKAEDKYGRALEKALCGPSQVALACLAWLRVNESSNDQLGKEDVAQQVVTLTPQKLGLPACPHFLWATLWITLLANRKSRASTGLRSDAQKVSSRLCARV